MGKKSQKFCCAPSKFEIPITHLSDNVKQATVRGHQRGRLKSWESAAYRWCLKPRVPYEERLDPYMDYTRARIF